MVSKKVVIEIRGKNSTKGAFDSAKANLKKLDKDVQKAFDKIGKASKILGVTVAAGLGVSIKTAIDFEDAFSGIKKTVEASEAEFDELNNNIREIAKQSPSSVVELAAIGEMAGQLGVAGVDNITKFIDTISKVVVTTNLTQEQASSDFAKIANIMNEPLDNIERMVSSVVDLGNNFATNESDIVSFANRIAGASKIVDLTTADIFGIGAAFSSVGIEAEAGGTAVQKVLLGINQAVIEGGGSLKTFAKVSELSVSEFSDLWEQDASAAFEKFVIGLGKQGDNAVEVLGELDLTDSRLIKAFLSLSNNGDLLTESLGKSTQAFEENTALATEAEKKYETTASQIEIMKNNVSDAAIELGTALLPQFNSLVTTLTEDVVPKIKDAITWFQEHQGAVDLVKASLLFLIGTFAAFKAITIGAALVTFFGTTLPAALVISSTGVGILSGVLAALPLAIVIGVSLAGLSLVFSQINQLKGDFEALGESAERQSNQIDEISRRLRDAVDAGDNERADRLRNLLKSQLPQSQTSPLATSPEDLGFYNQERIGLANGGDFIVPSGFPNDSFEMGVSSGERVTVQTDRQQQNSGININNVNINNDMDLEQFTTELGYAMATA